MATRDYLSIDIGGTYIKYAIVDEAFGMKKQDKGCQRQKAKEC